MQEPIKYMDYPTLCAINKSSMQAGRNQNLVIETLPVCQDDYFPVVRAFLHNDVELRTVIVLNKTGETGTLDMSFDQYRLLPTFDGGPVCQTE